METRSIWQTNRLAIIGLLLGVLTFLVSPPFIMLLGLLNYQIWNFYFGYFLWSHEIFWSERIIQAFLIGLTGLIIGIVSIKREKQKRWIAIIAIVLGIYGILAQCLGVLIVGA